MKPILFWLGAGKAKFPALNANDYQKVILVEAQSNVCSRLRETYQSQDNVEVLNTCITTKTQNSVQSFNVSNVNEFSSLLLPTGLNDLFPGLKIIKSVDVDTTDLAEVFGRFSSEYEYELIVDLPDLAGQVIQQLSEDLQLQSFSQISVSCGISSLYEGASNYEQISDILKSEYFEQTLLDDSDPDIPFVKFSFDAKAKKLFELEAKTAELSVSLADANQKVECLVNEREEFKSLAEATNDEVEKLRLGQESALKNADELAKQLFQSDSDLKEASETVNSLQKQVADLKSVLLEKDAQNDQLQTDLSSQKAELEGQATTIEAFRESHQELSKAIETKTQLISAAESKLNTLNELFEKQNAESAESRSRFETQINGLRDTLDKAESELEITKSEKSELAQHLKALQEQLTDYNDLKELVANKELQIQEFEIDKNKALENQKQLEETVTQLQAEKDTIEQTWSRKVTTLQQELEQSKKYYDCQQQAAMEAQSGLEATLSKLKAEKEATEQKLSQDIEALNEKNITDEKQLKTIENDKLKADDDLKTLKEKYKALEQYNEALKRKVEESNKASLQQSHALDLTSKLNMKMHVDLDRLRAKYSQKVESEAALRDLIAELHEKLQQAANFYRKLESSNPELLGGKSD